MLNIDKENLENLSDQQEISELFSQYRKVSNNKRIYFVFTALSTHYSEAIEFLFTAIDNGGIEVTNENFVSDLKTVLSLIKKHVKAIQLTKQ